MKELNQRALKIMHDNKVESVLVTDDGNIFLLKNKNAAMNHARNLNCKVSELKKSELLKELNKKEQKNQNNGTE